MAKAAHSEDLKKAFLAHQDETEGQIERLQRLFEIFEKRVNRSSAAGVPSGGGISMQSSIA